MDINLWLRGIIIGFSIAAPVGPIGVLCIRCTLDRGRTAGLVSGLGLAETGGNYMGSVILVFGVFTGSSIWWLILSSAVSWWSAKFNLHRLQSIDRFAGVIIVAFGILALLTTIG